MAQALIDKEAERLNDSLVNKSDLEKLEQIIHKAELLLNNIGINVDPQNITFEIVDSNELKKYKPTMDNIVGLTCPISREGKLHKIWLLENQTYIFLLSVVAHEMGHTWWYDNRLKSSLMEEEGFCELLAYYVLSTQFSKLGNQWKVAMMEWKDPIYGDGLRYMKQLFDNCNGSWFKFRAFIKLTRR